MDEAIKVGKLVIVQYPEIFYQLGKEVHQHPALAEILANQEIKEFEVFLAEVAAYCNFQLDATYNQDEIEHICELCLAELQKRRIQIIQ